MKTISPFISHHPFLTDLSDEHLEILAGYGMERTFEDGALILEQGGLANRFYLIHSGHVRLSSAARDGSPVEIEIIGAGDVLGWSWLFAPQLWQFDASAVGRTETVFFYATPLLAELEENPALGYELMRRVAAIAIRRLQSTRGKLIACRTDSLEKS